MSGIEAAGIALAVLPLVVKGISRYKQVLQPVASLASHNRYCEEVQAYKVKLRVEKQLFHDHCVWILQKVQAEEALKEVDSDNFNIDEFAQKEEMLGCYLGSMHETFALVLALVLKLLLEIDNSARAVYEEYKQRPRKGRRPAASNDCGQVERIWVEQFKQRLKFCFSRPRLMNCLEQLKEQNGDLLRLRQSFVDTLGIAEKANDSIDCTYNLERFELVRKASSNLYHDISCIGECSIHSEHSANICLGGNADTFVAGEETLSAQQRVRFDMGLIFKGTENDWVTRAQLSLQIESSVGCGPTGNPIMTVCSNTQTGAVAGALRTREEELSENDAHLTKKRTKRPKKSVSFLVSSEYKRKQQQQQQQQSDKQIVPTKQQKIIDKDGPLPNLYSRKDLCNFLEKQCHNSPLDSLICVGIFQSAATSIKHIIYRPPLEQSDQHPASLYSILGDLSQCTPYTGLRGLDCIRLARYLAVFVLQFCTTPWLSETWSTKDVFFQQNASNQESWSNSIQAPRLKVELSPRRKLASLPEVQSSLLNPIRNNIIHRLGVIMFELCFQSNLRDLQLPEDTLDGSQFIDHRIVTRLADTVDGPLGKKFGKIARKCIGCDFGVGEYDITSSKLQAAFHKDVVQELASLEVLFRKFSLDID